MMKLLISVVVIFIPFASAFWAEELLERVNTGFGAISNQGLTDIEKQWVTDPEIRYFRSDKTHIRLTAEEEAWLNAHKTIRFAAFDRFPSIKTVTIYNQILSKYPQIILLPFNTCHEAMEAVSTGKADAFILSLPTIEYYQVEYPSLKIAGLTDIASSPFMFAICKDYPKLVSVLDKAIASISKEEHDRIRHTWFGVRMERAVNWSVVLRWVAGITGFFMILLGMMLYWNQRLTREITERKQAEEALRKSEERFALAMQGANDGLWDWNIEIGRIYFSPRWKSMLGYAEHEVEPTLDAWKELVHPDDLLRTFELVEQYLAGTTDRYEVEFRMRHKDGHYMDILSRASVLRRNSDGKPLRTVGTHVDITEWKRSEHALKQAKEASEEARRAAEAAQKASLETQRAAEAANRAKSTFLANMSHEIRTPMNAILGFADILGEKLAGFNLPQYADSDLRQYTDLIRNSGKTLLGLINDILDLSKIEAGKLELTYIAVNPRVVCQDVVQIFSQKVSKKGLNFVLDIDPELPEYLLFDEIRLRQILLNLVGNAVKFTEEGSIILKIENCQVNIEDRNGEENPPQSSIANLQLSIQDTGIGIPDDQRESIFQAFEQRQGQNVRYGGTGLGLAITKCLVDLMGGDITVSGEVGQGSMFTVTFYNVQVVAAPETIEAEPPVNVDAIRFNPATILVADDVPDNRRLVLDYLDAFDVTLIEAADGHEAVELTRRHQPDVVLMDLKMPGMDGREATRILKADQGTRKIPVIALTAATIKETADEIASLCDGYLRKPVEKATLITELTKFLDHTIVTVPFAEMDQSSNAPEAPDAETLERVPELLHILETLFMPRWEEIQGFLIMDDVKQFTAELSHVAQKYHFWPLLDYADQLSEDAQCYRVSEVKGGIAKFPKLVEQVKDWSDGVME